jgi:hypothetical protein
MASNSIVCTKNEYLLSGLFALFELTIPTTNDASTSRKYRHYDMSNVPVCKKHKYGMP